ncbi:MAG: glutamate synthase subunit beta [Campylobacterales bacterium]|nr:glutamate synthase subunit beta [Campylobacterales bacterium]
MQGFIDTERVEPTKRNVLERLKDFNEIYESLDGEDAKWQANRCVQCGDPYCMNKCPLHNFIPQWLKKVSENDFEFAFLLSNHSSPFPEIMGRVCPHDRLCEGDCTLNDGFGAITIGAIETYISEEGFKRGLKPDFSIQKTDKRVAIIGSGPAGLSCATYLLRAGINVDMFERADMAGGLLTYGIPGFKLDKDVVKRRVDILVEAGLNLKLNCEVGSNISFEEIDKNYDAIFLGIGATKPNSANVKNENSNGVIQAIEFLTEVQKKNFNKQYLDKVDVKGKNVVVIGGGDTAMDCVRTSIRLGALSVKCLYRRDSYNMPGSKKEYKNAIEEGVEFVFNVSPKEIVVDNNNCVKSIIMQKTSLTQADSKGRQKCEVVEGNDYEIEADIVILSLGFSQEIPEFLKSSNIECDSSGNIVINSEFATTNSKIYAGGDCRRGADLVVTAAFDGREAAKSIIKKLI